MHCNFLAASRSIAFDDILENLTVLFPNLSFFAAEADILLDSLGKSERGLALSSAAIESLLLVGDERIKDFLKFLTIAVGIKRKTRKRSDCLSEKSCLKP